MQDSPKIKEIISRTKNANQRRLNLVYDVCKGMKICEGNQGKNKGAGDNFDEFNPNKPDQDDDKVRSYCMPSTTGNYNC